ncbi:MAG: class I SAM-dependent methyltransferase [Anaerolineae bacterium]
MSTAAAAALTALAIAGLLTLFVVIVTDGRYGGKPLMRWIYNRFGASIFSAQSEAERWRKLAETLPLRGDEAILDVGTAVGDLPLTIAGLPNFSGRAAGVDWSPRMMSAAQKQARRQGAPAHFAVVDVRRGLPFASGQFAIVFCLGLLETLPKAENLLLELARVLKGEGTLVVSLYRGWSAWSAALSERWYRQHLPSPGKWEVQVAPCRRGQEVVIARRRRELV